MEDLDKIDHGMHRPRTAADHARKAQERQLASQFLRKHAPDLHEMIMGEELQEAS